MATISYVTTTLFDFGAIARLGKGLQRLGIKRPLSATDRGVADAGILAKVDEAIGGAAAAFDAAPRREAEGARGGAAAPCAATPANPTESAVMDAAALYRESGADGVIALG